MGWLRVGAGRIRTIFSRLRNRIRPVWDSPWTGAAILLVLYILAFYWYRNTPAPGKAVLVLAVGATVMTFRKELTPTEKTFLTFVLFIFAWIEIRAINQDRTENQAQQKKFFDKQQEDFKAITMQAETNFGDTSAGLHAAISGLQVVMGTTEKVASVANENLENITGANSFAYVFPSEINEGESVITLNIHNGGSHTLLGVVVTIREVLVGSLEPDAVGPLSFVGPSAIEIGSLAPDDGRTIPAPYGFITPHLKADGTCAYRIWVNSQAPGSTENLYFRRSQNGRGLSYRFDVAVVVRGKHRRGELAPGKRPS